MAKKNDPTSRWPSVNPGSLVNQIIIQYQAPGVDAIGQPVNVWNTLCTCYAAIDDNFHTNRPEGRQLYEGGFVTARSTHLITMRWNGKKIMPGMRVLFADGMYSPPAIHYYNIQWVENVEQRNVLLRLEVWEINGVG